ncbi:MAG: RNA-binding protein [Gallionellales bacterium 35-53-114]|jgi:ribosome-associated heat shock protein Hsp15|nr:MAG: RNA-binding protein [Gallionellales bacterium 35-53-114]OYZ62493.1 MAG: RNA-binding protein [Gallionellales bacterium 24-53-125]OZB08552.1 MAG: RNA-binding protein [Gallionellales bacterium 39-52-133]HQS59524.1 S4 domain-containing protein [Gallionellaceae bacterium]HQS76437.1 S4 domain-containing protein [Gallionellaceae bacterium]
MPHIKNAESAKLRIDKWLWAARFFKTRSLAIAAIESGKVEINEVRVKPAKSLDIGDLIAIRLGPYQFVVEVLLLSDKRGPAPQAQKLYKETEESIRRREELAFERKAQAQIVTRGEGRPTKKDRREIERFKSGAW